MRAESLADSIASFGIALYATGRNVRFVVVSRSRAKDKPGIENKVAPKAEPAANFKKPRRVISIPCSVVVFISLSSSIGFGWEAELYVKAMQSLRVTYINTVKVMKINCKFKFYAVKI